MANNCQDFAITLFFEIAYGGKICDGANVIRELRRQGRHASRVRIERDQTTGREIVMNRHNKILYRL